MMGKNWTALKCGSLLIIAFGLAACTGTNNADFPTSAATVDIDMGCVGGPSSTCKFKYEWQTANCGEVPIAGIDVTRCWMTKRYIWPAGGSQLFQAYSPEAGGTYVSLNRAFGYRGGPIGKVAAINASTVFGGPMSLEGKYIDATDVSVSKDDGGGDFGASFKIPGRVCQGYRKAGPMGFDQTHSLWIGSFTLCKPEGAAVSIDELLRVVQRVQFR